MARRLFSYLCIAVLGIMLSVAHAPALAMPCCNEPAMHDMHSTHNSVEKCCESSFCAKCFSPAMNFHLPIALPAAQTKTSFTLYSENLATRATKAPERPPRALV